MGKKLHVLTSRASEDLSGTSSPYAASRLRQSLFHGSGAAPYPSAGSLSPQHDASRRRREMGWNTSFPAEYHRTLHSKDYEQTLAFEEQLRQREEIDADTMPLPCTTKTRTTGSKIVRGPSSITAATKNKKLRDAELELHKCVTVREGLVTKLHELADTYKRDGSGSELAQNVLHLLLQLRDASVNVMRAMAAWHTAQQPPLTAFRFESDHYCVKMVMDLNFLATHEALSQSLGVDPTKMKQNPFMMPTPIPDREFADMCAIKSQPRFSFSDAAERVAQAEKYLVWCLMHLPDVEDTSDNVSDTAQTLAPPSYESSAGDRSEMLLTWQQRAEQQLRLLSMPMEAPSGQIHVMDSSRMMKRKGYLPSLPSSPPKTLTELMQQNHLQQQQLPPPSSSPGGRRNNGSCFTSFEVELGDVTFRTTALDLELLGSHDTPPHAIVTLVAASVLILLSPCAGCRVDCKVSFITVLKMHPYEPT
ncbi:hypothetical protein PINS_up017442 [Pythium insidiosum]|nr:hypothetical protein PINS_up017442 [Pythium insidiosum]